MRVLALLSGLVAVSLVMTAQTSAMRLTATTENVSGAGEAIRINLTNWSTDADRDQMVAAWNLTARCRDASRGSCRAWGTWRRRPRCTWRRRAGGGGDGAAALPADPDAADAGGPTMPTIPPFDLAAEEPVDEWKPLRLRHRLHWRRR